MWFVALQSYQGGYCILVLDQKNRYTNYYHTNRADHLLTAIQSLKDMGAHHWTLNGAIPIGYI